LLRPLLLPHPFRLSLRRSGEGREGPKSHPHLGIMRREKKRKKRREERKRKVYITSGSVSVSVNIC
jgi:hypothetical protein